MDRTLSWIAAEHALDSLESGLAEVDAAISLVLAGLAVTVRLCNFASAEDVAFDAAARAQTAGVGFSLRRDGARWPTLVVGPRLLAAVEPHGVEPAAEDPA